MTQIGLFEGKQKRDEGIKQVSGHNESFLELMRHTAKQISRQKGRVTVDELRQHAADRGLSPQHKNAWGALFHESGWTQIGWQHSEWKSNHARVIGVWRWDGRPVE